MQFVNNILACSCYLVKCLNLEHPISRLSFFLQILKKGLQNILTVCKSANTTCRPLDQMSATVLLALVENIKNPGLLPHLRRIVLDQSLPLDVRAKAVLAIRPLAKIIPSKVCILFEN